MNNLASARPVTAVIVTYQSARTIGRTLAAARRCHDEQLLDVVIVDNNSQDATAEIIQREADWARIILTGKNNGFGRGCNIGFAQVASPYTIFINPDAVVEPEAIRSMLQFMEKHPKSGIVGPATLCGEDEGEGVFQGTGYRTTPWTILHESIPLVRHRSSSWAIEPGSAPTRTGWVVGAILMIRTTLMKQLNGFDPRFFLYWEEMDLCKRAEEAGFEIWALGTALAHHIVGASSSQDATRYAGVNVARHYYQSRYYYMVKHHGRLAATIAEVGEFLLLGMGGLADVVRGRGLHRFRPRMQASLLSMPESVSDER
jgi:N-acetylglucosaminyl-diphospho-decaprenol L-rhamnosyltransferase